MTKTTHGPTLAISEEMHGLKHRQRGETFDEAMSRIANALADDSEHYHTFRNILRPQAFLPGGRVQASIGSPRKTTALNCYVSGTIPDSMSGIMQAATNAALTMRLGGGIGYDFSTLRPAGDHIKSLDSKSSGPLSFMRIFDSVCQTVASAGQRRGAQMGVMRVDHPDIEAFVEAKTNETEYTQFNLSVGVTDEFMQAVVDGGEFDLRFGGRVYATIDARYLWDKIMRATWDWAEPGILFLDRINNMNNLWYCETIAATNPCGEQPLPPDGACLLGSFNLVKYLTADRKFDITAFRRDIPPVIRAMDNIIDRTIYPLPAQEQEAKQKRRMGIGVTAVANAGECMGYVYGSDEYLVFQDVVLDTLAAEAYRASALLAAEKGPFPLYDEEKFLASKFVQTLPSDVQDLIRTHGIRNSHLLSIAPTGTNSLCADNVSSGIEPVFAHSFERTIKTDDGDRREIVKDWAYHNHGVLGRTADECSPADHVNVLIRASARVDSAVSKTINIGDHVTWGEFRDVYMAAWKGGCKGCTTFRKAGKRYGILNVVADETACYIDPATGKKECG